MSKQSIPIDKEVFDNSSVELIYIICLDPFTDIPPRQWHLRLGRYLAYGLYDSIVGGSSKEDTTKLSSMSTKQTPLSGRIRIEPGINVITIESDDLDGYLPTPKVFEQASSPTPQVPSTSSLPFSTIDIGIKSSKGQSIVPCL